MKWGLSQECRDGLTLKISECNWLYYQTKNYKPHEHLNKHRENTWQNSVSISDINSQQSKKRRELSSFWWKASIKINKAYS